MFSARNVDDDEYDVMPEPPSFRGLSKPMSSVAEFSVDSSQSLASSIPHGVSVLKDAKESFDIVKSSLSSPGSGTPPSLPPPPFALERTHFITSHPCEKLFDRVQNVLDSMCIDNAVDTRVHSWKCQIFKNYSALRMLVRMWAGDDGKFVVEMQRQGGAAGEFLNLYGDFVRRMSLDDVPDYTSRASLFRPVKLAAGEDETSAPLPPVVLKPLISMIQSPFIETKLEGAKGIAKFTDPQSGLDRSSVRDTGVVPALVPLLDDGGNIALYASAALRNLVCELAALEGDEVQRMCTSTEIGNDFVGHMVHSQMWNFYGTASLEGKRQAAHVLASISAVLPESFVGVVNAAEAAALAKKDGACCDRLSRCLNEFARNLAS